MRRPVLYLLLLVIFFSSVPANAQYSAPTGGVVIAQSKLYEAPDNKVQRFSESINLNKGQDKLILTLTYYNGTATAPGFSWIRVTSSSMSYLTEKQFGPDKTVSIDVTGELASGGNQITVEAGGVKGSTFGWRLTAQRPQIASANPPILEPGETVTVSGTSFSGDPTAAAATFNGEPLQCISASHKNLVLKIPDDLKPSNGVLQITDAGIDAGKLELSSQISVPVLDSLDSGWVCPGTNLVINGGPFGSRASDVHVFIGPFEAQVVAVANNSLTVQAPLGFLGLAWGVHQPIHVIVNGVRARNVLTVNCYNDMPGILN